MKEIIQEYLEASWGNGALNSKLKCLSERDRIEIEIKLASFVVPRPSQNLTVTDNVFRVIVEGEEGAVES